MYLSFAEQVFLLSHQWQNRPQDITIALDAEGGYATGVGLDVKFLSAQEGRQFLHTLGLTRRRNMESKDVEG